MYKPTSPQQRLFGIETRVSPSLRKRLESSWAELFRNEILPILFRNEDRYAILYGSTGRPNFSVARLLGLCLLQEWNDLSDQETLDTFSFDIRWRYALDVNDDEDYLSRRSLVEFRRRLVVSDPDMKLIRDIFDTVRDSAIRKMSLSVSDQRLDSTLVVSNIRVKGRLALFSDTLTLFLKGLDNERLARVPEAIRTWYSSEPEGWFGLGSSEQTVRLEELAQYLYDLISLFEDCTDEPYLLLKRLFSEHCGINGTSVHLKKRLEGSSLQSPYDPDASFGHKGSGYSVHVTETCGNDGRSEIITDYEVHGSARSDMGKALDVIERLDTAGLKPDTLFADGGYPSVPSASRIVDKGTKLMAPVNRSRLGDDVIGRDLFVFDQDGRVMECPMGHAPIDHRVLSRNNTVKRSLHAIFDGDTCRSCTMLDNCPVRTPNHRARGCKARDSVGNFRLDISREIRLRDEMYAVQHTREWKDRYSIRTGIEGTNSELKRAHGMMRIRLRRLVKVCISVACKVTACNIKRWARAYAAAGGPLWYIMTGLIAYTERSVAMTIPMVRPSWSRQH
jgi:hypothetical protein